MTSIVVCSKGRPTACPTIRDLEQTDLPWKVTLEEDDVQPYIDAGLAPERVIVLGQAGRGGAYARREALAWYRRRHDSDSWLWMLDDDITKWYEVIDKRCKPRPLADVLLGAEQMFTTDKTVALAALEYQQFAWSATKPVKFNGYCDVAVCFHLGRTVSMAHRDGFKHDRDFALQVLTGGYRTARVQKYAFACPPIGSNKGGLHDQYKRDAVQQSCDEMLRRWGPDLIQIVEKKNGLPDAKVDWRAFAGRNG